ncbi:MAG: hypothetical protein ACLQAT_29855 [Candidatus Binataceae bacterium]
MSVQVSHVREDDEAGAPPLPDREQATIEIVSIASTHMADFDRNRMIHRLSLWDTKRRAACERSTNRIALEA